MVAAELRAQFNGLNDKIDSTLQGPQGNPGVVTNMTLASAIAGTARNPTGIPTLDTPFADPDAEALRQFCNTLLTALFRAPV